MNLALTLTCSHFSNVTGKKTQQKLNCAVSFSVTKSAFLVLTVLICELPSVVLTCACGGYPGPG